MSRCWSAATSLPLIPGRSSARGPPEVTAGTVDGVVGGAVEGVVEGAAVTEVVGGAVLTGTVAVDGAVDAGARVVVVLRVAVFAAVVSSSDPRVARTTPTTTGAIT